LLPIYISQSAFTEVINKHMPLKKRKPVVNPAPYMNKELRQAIYKKFGITATRGPPLKPTHSGRQISSAFLQTCTRLS
jgi:hypothetical protein